MLKLLVIGNLGKDATCNNVNGKNVINFSVAHTEKYKDAQGNQQQKTTWVDCSWWSDRTAIVPYLKKGIQVYLEGNPEVRTFSKQDGTTGTSLSVRVLTVQLLGGGNGNNSQGGTTGQANNSGNNYTNAASYGGSTSSADDGDLPF